MGRKVSDRDLTDRSETIDDGVVVDDQGAVKAAPNVQFHPIGTEAFGLEKRLERVLSEAVGVAPVRKDSGHGHSLADPTLTSP